MKNTGSEEHAFIPMEKYKFYQKLEKEFDKKLKQKAKEIKEESTESAKSLFVNSLIELLCDIEIQSIDDVLNCNNIIYKNMLVKNDRRRRYITGTFNDLDSSFYNIWQSPDFYVDVKYGNGTAKKQVEAFQNKVKDILFSIIQLDLKPLIEKKEEGIAARIQKNYNKQLEEFKENYEYTIPLWKRLFL